MQDDANCEGLDAKAKDSKVQGKTQQSKPQLISGIGANDTAQAVLIGACIFKAVCLE